MNVESPESANLKLIQSIDRFGLWLTELVMAHRWLALAATILVLGLVAPGVTKLSLSPDYRIFFGDDNPQLLAFDNMEEQYAPLENFLFVVKPGDNDVFSASSYPIIQRVTELAWALPGVNRVNSISNYQHTEADGDDLSVSDLLEEGVAYSATELAEKRRIALAEPTLVGYLISHDASTAGIDARATLGDGPEDNLVVAMVAARAMLAQLREEFPDVTFALSGESPMSNGFVEAASVDMAMLIPLMYLAIILAMLIIFRSISATLITLVVVFGSTLWALGLAGYAGVELTALSTNAPIIIMTLAVADSVHVLMSMLALMRRGRDKIAAIKESMRINFVAVAITSGTTMIGFSSFNFSDVPPMNALGNITLIGIFGAWALTVILIPALVLMLPFNIKEVKELKEGGGRLNFVDVMLGVSRFTVKRYRAILLVLLPLSLLLASLIPRLVLDDQFVGFFNPRLEIRRDIDFTLENLTGPYQINFDIGSGAEDGITSPEYLRQLEDFALWLRAQPEVLSVYSFSDEMKRLNKSMHGDDPNQYRLPEEQQLAAQYLLLYELSLPYGLDLGDRIKFDKSGTRVTIVLKNLTAAEQREIDERANRWLQQNTAAVMHSEGAGPALMFAHLTKRSIDSMIVGNILAVLMITTVMMIALSSFRLGLLSMVPNLLPIVVGLGIWSIFVGMVGMPTSVVGVASLGIVVDNTTHFLSKYVRARKEALKSRAESIDYAFEMVGPALVANAFILIAGFSLLAFSTFRPNFEMGVLLALIIAVALIIDLLLLPALLIFGQRLKSAAS